LFQSIREGVADADEDIQEEFVGSEAAIDELASEYRDALSLTIWFGTCSLADLVAEAIQSGVDQDLRGDFCPTELALTVGYHDLFEQAEHPDGFLIARPFVSVRFWGYGAPTDCELARERILGLMTIEKIKKELSEVIGPLDAFVYWDI
jgi:hypothetical protein